MKENEDFFNMTSDLFQVPSEISDIERLKGLQKITISAAELNQIFEEWNASGKKDLEINEILYEKIKEYNDNLNKLTPLKESITNRFMKRYTVDKKNVMKSTATEIRLYINQKYIGLIDMFWFKKGSSSLSIVRGRDFLYMLAASGNKIISHQQLNDSEIYIDFRLWTLDMKGELDFDSEYGKCYMTIN